MKIALISVFLDDGYEHILDDKFMEDVVCQEDHHYHRTAHSLKMRNHEPIVFYISVEKELKKFTHKYGHTIIRIPVKKIPFFHEPLVYSPTLIEQIEKEFDICYLVSGYYVMYKVPDMFDYVVKKLHNKMPIIARWAGGNQKWLFPIRKTIKKNTLNKCENIICSGKDEINILKDKFKIPEKKIVHMFNPIDTEQFKPRMKSEIIGKIDFDQEKKYFLYVGRLTHNHGIEILLDVFKTICKNNKDIILLFIGDGSMNEKIKQYIQKNNLDESIKLKGRLSHEMISYYYNISSALFHVGNSGGMPNVIMESIVSGLPVIAADSIAANKDLVNEQDGTGILVETGNKLQLEQAISKILIQNKNIQLKKSDIIKEFSIEKYGKEMNKIFEEITL